MAKVDAARVPFIDERKLSQVGKPAEMVVSQDVLVHPSVTWKEPEGEVGHINRKIRDAAVERYYHSVLRNTYPYGRDVSRKPIDRTGEAVQHKPPLQHPYILSKDSYRSAINNVLGEEAPKSPR